MRRVNLVSSSLTITALFALFLFCSRDLGDSPVGPQVDEDTWVVDDDEDSVAVDSTGLISISVSPSVLGASLRSSATVTVRVLNQNLNPIEGDTVEFRARYGGVIYGDNGSKSITNNKGEAYATFQGVQKNVEARIDARVTIGTRIMTVSTRVTIEGLKVFIDPATRTPIINTVNNILISVLDADNNPVENVRVDLVGTRDAFDTTAGDGTFITSITSGSAGKKAIRAIALGDTAWDTVTFYRSASDIPTGVGSGQGGDYNISVYSSRSQIKADNSDYAMITARVWDQNRNPVAGETVTFSCAPIGYIDPSAVVDQFGRATARLMSEPKNGTCTVKATSSQNETATTQVVFSGVRIHLSADNAELTVGDTATVEALVLDASNNPVGEDNVRFLISGSGASFVGGEDNPSVELGPTGKATVSVVSTSAGTKSIYASSANTSDTISIKFSTSNLTLSSSKSSIQVGGVQYATITATYVDSSNQPVEGVVVSFATNAGQLSTLVDTTNSQGKASARLYSADFSGTATVQATAPGGNAKVTVNFTAAAPAGINLKITPDNIVVNGGVATLVATVTDVNGNMVSGASVNFKIVKSPGGGEHIAAPVVTTTEGTARSQLLAGSIPSQYRACEVIAIVVGSDGEPKDSASSKLTISGEPYIVTVSRPEDDTVKVLDGGDRIESVFECFVGAVVQDINGNPVADNTEVHFSVVVSGMTVARLVLDHWAGIESADEVKAVLRYEYLDIPFEDINNNMRMDANIDLTLDYDNSTARRGDDADGNGVVDYNPLIHDFFWDFNGNGVCDPGVCEPCYDMTYIRNIIKIDSTIDTSVQIKERKTPVYDTSVVIGNDTAIIYDTSITIEEPKTPIYDTNVVIGNDTAIIYDTSITIKETQTPVYDTTITLAYTVDEKTDTNISVNYLTVTSVDTTIIPREDTMFVRYDTVPAGTVVCDTVKDTVAGTIYLVYCYNDSIFAVYELIARSDTNYTIRQDTIGVRYDTTYAITYDTTGTYYDTTVTLSYLITSEIDTAIAIRYDITSTIDTVITPRYLTTPVIDTTITLQYLVTPTIDTIVDLRYLATSYIDTAITVTYITRDSIVDSTCTIWADLNQNGVWDKSELAIDHNGNGVCDLPESGDFNYALWEMRPYWRGMPFDFSHNQFAVVVPASVPTEGGVALAQITYPRQFARRLIVSVNAEANGVRDREGERFVLPQIK